jgi:hypothetical protein
MAPKKRPYATPNLVQNPGSAMEMSWEGKKKKKGFRKKNRRLYGFSKRISHRSGG